MKSSGYYAYKMTLPCSDMILMRCDAAIDHIKNPGWKAGEWACVPLVVSDRYSLKKICRHKGGRYGISLVFYPLGNYSESSIAPGCCHLILPCNCYRTVQPMRMMVDFPEICGG
jgi:hypothetical protein